jgi:hypothetical protein
MTRVNVDGGSLLEHVVAAQLQLTAEEAVEKISRLEVFTTGFQLSFWTPGIKYT